MAARQDRSQRPKPVKAERAFFIKLGDGGRWESQCLNEGKLRFGYRHIPHELCEALDWPAVARTARGFTADRGAATRHVKQIQTFYEADKRVLWVTFYADCLWWCFSEPKVSALPDNDKSRRVVRAWSNLDLGGKSLLKSRLSGKLLAVQKYRGTICSVRELDYLLHKINGTAEPHVAAAQVAFETLQTALIPIIKNLHEKDLEVLVDLVFRQAGWQRVGVLGGTELDIDLDLISPVTGERIAVQVKSEATASVWKRYRDRYADMQGFSRFYFVTHSPGDRLRGEATNADDADFILWDAEQIALMAIRGGLTGWLLDKAS